MTSSQANIIKIKENESGVKNETSTDNGVPKIFRTKHLRSQWYFSKLSHSGWPGAEKHEETSKLHSPTRSLNGRVSHHSHRFFPGLLRSLLNRSLSTSSQVVASLPHPPTSRHIQHKKFSKMQMGDEIAVVCCLKSLARCIKALCALLLSTLSPQILAVMVYILLFQPSLCFCTCSFLHPFVSLFIKGCFSTYKELQQGSSHRKA